MGYELHIARKTDRDKDLESDITLKEWLAYVETDSELNPSNGRSLIILSEQAESNTYILLLESLRSQNFSFIIGIECKLPRKFAIQD